MGIPGVLIGSFGYGFCGHPDHEGYYTGVVVGDATNTVAFDGLPVGRIGSLVISSCGHSARIVQGSPSVNVEGLPASQLGAFFVGPYWSGNIIGGTTTTVEIG